MTTQFVTIYTKRGGVGIGKIDEKGRLIYRAGYWIPVSQDQPDLRDKLLRKDVTKIIKDGGKRYKEVLKGLALTSTYRV